MRLNLKKKKEPRRNFLLEIILPGIRSSNTFHVFDRKKEKEKGKGRGEENGSGERKRKKRYKNVIHYFENVKSFSTCF